MNLSTKKKIGIIVAVVCAIGAVVAAVLLLLNKPKTEEPVEETYYTVVFDTNGGGKIESQSVAFGSFATKPADPQKDGFTFVGWFSDKELTIEFNFFEPVSRDLTLYAKWDGENKPFDSEEAKQQTTQTSTQQISTNSRSRNGNSGNSSQSNPTPAPQPTPQPEPTPEPVYKIVATSVDAYSPDVKVAVTKNGVSVTFLSVKANGQEICNGSNPYTNRNELTSSTYRVTLSTGEVVSASL